jgi:recombination protein RecR
VKYPEALEKLIASFSSLPSVGPRAARKLSFFLLSQPQEFLSSFGEEISSIKENVTICGECFCLKNKSNCLYCDNAFRAKNQLCIVEERENVLTIEDYGIFEGVYHVLEGALSPINGVHPENLRIQELLTRLERQNFQEVIIATNPTIEGEATNHYLLEMLQKYSFKITRLACGIPSGGDIKYTDKATLQKAFQGRQSLKTS